MILCCGEALIDMIPETTVSGDLGFVPHPGGSVFNTAVALGRLEISVGMLTGLSDDMFGDQLKATLEASNVDTSHVVTSSRPTTLAFVVLVDGRASYSFFDESSAGRMLSTEDLPHLSPAVSVLYFGGISLACEPSADSYAAVLERYGSGCLVMIDPNIRPGFIDDRDRFLTRLDRMIALADIVKVSEEDLDWLDPGDRPQAAKAKSLSERGPALVIVTRGAEGASGYLRGGEIVECAAKNVDVVDTVGAGDIFNAGVLAELLRSGHLNKKRISKPDGGAVRRALDFGARVAAVSVGRAGADPPSFQELIDP